VQQATNYISSHSSYFYYPCVSLHNLAHRIIFKNSNKNIFKKQNLHSKILMTFFAAKIQGAFNKFQDCSSQ